MGIVFYLSLLAASISLFGLARSVIERYTGKETSKSKKMKNREPQYYIVRHQGNWFPIKLTSKDGYYFVKDLYHEEPGWDFVNDYSTTVSFDYPNLHSYNSKSKAKRVIEKLEGSEIIELDGPDIFAERGRNVGFERVDRDIGDLEDYESLNDYMYAKFKNRDLSKIKIGSEQASPASLRNSKRKYIQEMFGSNS